MTYVITASCVVHVTHMLSQRYLLNIGKISLEDDGECFRDPERVGPCQAGSSLSPRLVNLPVTAWSVADTQPIPSINI